MSSNGELKLGSILKSLRKEKGFNQEYLADILSIKRQTYSAWERDVSCPDVDTVNRLAELYGVSTDFIFGRTTTKEPYSVNQSEVPALVNSFSEIEDLSEESKKELEKYIHLLKMKDQMDKSKEEQSCASEKKA